MTRHRPPAQLPACYALVLPGLETVAAKEMEEDFNAEVKKTGRGVVVFRLPQIDSSILDLRTTEDVFLLAWGTDQLTYRAEDLDRIRRWTAREVNWEQLLRIHHAIRPKPKGKPTFRLVAQMTGTHGYRRIDARQALSEGLAGKLPSSWRHAEENAAIEIWLTIDGTTAVCGVRLSDRSMRHRIYKIEHVAASLRPTLAAALVRLAEVRSHQVILDPMCGAGTILTEALEWSRQQQRNLTVLGGDLAASALRAARANLRRVGQAHLMRWDASRLPLPDQSVDRVVSNPPFGKKLSGPREVMSLYASVLRTYDRILKPHGKAVLLVSDFPALKRAVRRTGWQLKHELRVRVLGQRATASVWQKT